MKQIYSYVTDNSLLRNVVWEYTPKQHTAVTSGWWEAYQKIIMHELGMTARTWKMLTARSGPFRTLDAIILPYVTGTGCSQACRTAVLTTEITTNKLTWFMPYFFSKGFIQRDRVLYLCAFSWNTIRVELLCCCCHFLETLTSTGNASRS